MIKFSLFSRLGTEYKFMMSAETRNFYWNDRAAPNRQDLIPVSGLDIKYYSTDSWAGIKSQLLEIRDMTDEEFILFKLKWL